MKINVLRRFALLAVVGCAITILAINRDKLNPDFLDTWLSSFGIWAPIIYIILFAIGTVLFAPGSVFALVGGAMFGPFWGTFLNLSGATIGAGNSFLVSRYLAGEWVAKKTGGRLKKLVDGVEKEGWRFVAFVRLVPLFPFNLTNYALGLTRIPFSSYMITSFVTMAPGALAFAWLGYAGRAALDGNASAIRYGLLALGLVAASAFLPRLIQRFRQGDVVWVKAEDLNYRMRTGERFLILDVREAEEFIGPQGHIKGALNIPVSDLSARLPEIAADSAETIIAVCRTDRRSSNAESILRDADWENISVLRGGMTRWNELSYDIDGETLSGTEV